jgi:hypothetical protein
MSKSKINVTIAANSSRNANSATPANAANSAVRGAFFLAFACETVEPSLTNAKSITYKTPSHSYTGPVHLYACTDRLK